MRCRDAQQLELVKKSETKTPNIKNVAKRTPAAAQRFGHQYRYLVTNMGPPHPTKRRSAAVLVAAA